MRGINSKCFDSFQVLDIMDMVHQLLWPVVMAVMALVMEFPKLFHLMQHTADMLMVRFSNSLHHTTICFQ